MKKTISKTKFKANDSIFGPPALFEGEDEQAYFALLEQVFVVIKPRDIIEEIWVREFVDLTWEILRWRRRKRELLEVEDTKNVQFVDKVSTMLGRAERIEQLIASAEHRRSALQREVRFHRSELAERLAESVNTIEFNPPVKQIVSKS